MSDNPPGSPPRGAISPFIRRRRLLNGADIRTARAGLQMSVQELAGLSGVSAKAISRIENGQPAITSNLDAIRRVFEQRGVFFQFDGAVFFSGKAEK